MYLCSVIPYDSCVSFVIFVRYGCNMTRALCQVHCKPATNASWHQMMVLFLLSRAVVRWLCEGWRSLRQNLFHIVVHWLLWQLPSQMRHCMYWCGECGRFVQISFNFSHATFKVQPDLTTETCSCYTVLIIKVNLPLIHLCNCFKVC